MFSIAMIPNCTIALLWYCLKTTRGKISGIVSDEKPHTEKDFLGVNVMRLFLKGGGGNDKVISRRLEK